MTLISILVTLHAETDATLPRDLGRAVYSLVLDNLNRVERRLSEQIHAGDGPKPLTCSGILNGQGNRDGMAVKAGESYYIRVTGLTERVSGALQAAFLTDAPASVALDRQPFGVVETSCNRAVNPWCGRTSYEMLAAAHMLSNSAPPREVSFSFASPVAFKSGGAHMPLPLPGLVFGSLVDRWNQFSSVKLDEAMRGYGEETVAISRYELNSVPVIHKNGAMRIGGIGKVTYTALDGDRYWFAAMNMLADFALYSGVGVQTTTGMGQVRRVS